MTDTNFNMLVLAILVAVAYGIATSRVAPIIAGFFARAARVRVTTARPLR
jgi:hypothetical protein